MKKTKAQKALDAVIDASFKKNGNCIQFNIFDLSKIHRAGEVAAAAGQDIDAAIIAAIAVYRKN